MAYHIPFEMRSYFGEVKQYFVNRLPIMDGKPEENMYMPGIAKAKFITKNRLVEHLVITTNELLQQINSLMLYEKGLITDADKLKLELIINNRKLELDAGYISNSQDEETRYRNILKAWFKDEKKFVDELTPIFNANSINQNFKHQTYLEISPPFMPSQQIRITTFEEFENWLREQDNKHFEQLVNGLSKMEEYINKQVHEDVHADKERLHQLKRNLTNWKYQIHSIFNPIKESGSYLTNYQLNKEQNVAVDKIKSKIDGALKVVDLRLQGRERNRKKSDNNSKTLYELLNKDETKVSLIKEAIKDLNISSHLSERQITGFITGCKKAKALPELADTDLFRAIYIEIGKEYTANVKPRYDNKAYAHMEKTTKKYFGIV